MKPRFLLVGSCEYSGSGKGMTYYGEALTSCGFATEFMSFGEPHACVGDPERYAGMLRHVVDVQLLPFDSSPGIAASQSLTNEIVRWIELHIEEDIVLWGHYLYPFGCSVLEACALMRESCRRLRCLLTPAGSDVWNPDLHLKPLVRRTVQLARPESIVFYSERFLREALKGYSILGDWRPRVIRPVVSDTYFAPAAAEVRSRTRSSLEVTESEPMVCIVSNMRARKNVEGLRNIFEALGILDLAPTVLLVGPDKGIHLDGCKTISTGVVADVRSHIQAADVSINVSLKDSFNFALLEAMLCGTPTMTTEAAAISAEMKLHDDACVIDLESERSISCAGRLIKRLLSERNFRDSYGLSQRKAMQKVHGLSLNQERYERDIMEAISGKADGNEEF